MSRLRQHPESHLVDRIGCLRAAVLRANDGIVSIGSLIVGVAAAAAAQNDVLIGGPRARAQGVRENLAFELDQLAEIYVKRGVDWALARQVAQQLMAKYAVSAHARDELGISEITSARPVQAALTSAATFSVGAAMPLLMVVISPAGALVPIVSAASLSFLALLGAIGATVQTSCGPPAE